jgi:hypothetical protein
MDLTDDVSALSMAGASTLGGHGFVSRLRKTMARMEVIQDDARVENDCGEGGGSSKHNIKSTSSKRRSTLHSIERMAALVATDETQQHQHTSASTGDIDVMLQTMPSTYEEWQKEKEKNSKHKPKKSSKRRDKERHGHKNYVDVVNSVSLPISEICFHSDAASSLHDATNSRTGSRTGSDSAAPAGGPPCCISVASTAESTNSRSANQSFGIAQGRRVSFGQHSTISGSPRCSSNNTSASIHFHDNEIASHASTSITISSINQLKSNLNKCQLEERQVLQIHTRLEDEVSLLTTSLSLSQQKQLQLAHELQSATIERERLQKYLVKMQEENGRLNVAVRDREECEDDERLDSVLHGMEKKMRALRVRRNG